MRRFRNIFYASITMLVVVALLGAGGTFTFLRSSLPATSGRLSVAGLQAPVEVIRDPWGIPHIYAQNEEDLFFAQGYVQAQDRLWQMELSRRAARGTLAELLGEQALAGDQLARTLGFAQAAEAEWAQIEPDARTVLEAYARGVNAFLAAPGRLPLEFGLLSLTPEPWQPHDTLAWARLLAWCLDGDWQQALVRSRLVQAVGAERAAELDPALASLDTQAGAVGDLAALAQATLLEAGVQVWPWAGSLGGATLALSGERAADGGAVLAAAPQLAVQMPSAWYEVQLVGGRYDLIGAGFAGLPGVAMGRNRAIAWSLSGSAADAMDLYAERVRPGSPPQAEYEGQWADLEARTEMIWVRGQAEPVHLNVYTTRHGPLVSTPEPDRQAQLALRWVGDGQPAALVHGVLAVNRAASWPEFEAALQGWAAPTLVVPYADVQGNVGYATAGAVPERASAGGALPLPGWTGGHEWSGLVTSAGLPKELRPAGSTLVAAGGAVSPPDWPERAWDDAQPSAAAKRIAEFLAGDDGLTVEDVQAIQCDDRGPEQPLLELLLAIPPQGWLQERTMPYLRDWDLRYDAESAGAGIYEAFYWRLVHNTLDDELGAELVDAYLNAYPDHRAVMERLAAQPDSPWFDDGRTPQRESRDEIIARSFADAVEWLGRRFGDLPYEWNWGRVHCVTFAHALGQSWPLNLLLNRGAMRAGGGPHSIDAAAPDYSQRMAVGRAPYRMIVDLAPGGRAVATNTTGQSGNPLSPHYADMIPSWRGGSYHPLLCEREAVLQAREGVLVLAPASP